MPESIPAGFKALADMSPFESLLIVDLGGTTLDVAKVQGQLAGISQVFCDPHVGVSLMADAVPVSYTHLDVYKRQEISHEYIYLMACSDYFGGLRHWDYANY